MQGRRRTAPEDQGDIPSWLMTYGDLMSLLKLDRRDLKDPPFTPALPPALLSADDSIFAAIRAKSPRSGSGRTSTASPTPCSPTSTRAPKAATTEGKA